ncbi:MAG: hypothetical protein Q4C04_08320 [Clostridia bacterium]|nr:hypothetical protein [Clostridia bacterium]
MKPYVKPVLQTLKLDNSDIITASAETWVNESGAIDNGPANGNGDSTIFDGGNLFGP